MCTAITLSNRQQQNVFGRTMDFQYDLDPHLAAFPTGTPWVDTLNETHVDRYAVAGVARHFNDRYVLFDGVNDQGLAGGALYFKGYADFPQPQENCKKEQVPALDFLHRILGCCAELDDVRALLENIVLVGIQDKVTGTVAPLHWIFADRSGRSIVVEQTKQGLNVYENPIGVMTNSPDFPWQLTNLRNYVEVTPEQPERADWDGFAIEPFGQAAGTSALPGGYTPPARFVRTAFQKLNMTCPDGMAQTIVAGFHVLEGVTLPRGVVQTANGSCDYTQYTSMIDLENKVYYFKTYENPQIIRVDVASAWASARPTAQDLGSICVPLSFQEISKGNAD